MKEMKRIISLLLCLVMLVGYLPVNARAEEAMTTEPSVVETAEETAAETTEETEPEKPGKPTKFGKHEKNDKPGKPEKEGKSEQETTPVTETTVPVTEATVPATTEATVPETTGETEPSVIAVTGITLDQTALEVGVGELPMSLTATVQPEDATDKTVTWTSSEPGVASVDENGTLAFGYMGEATITVTAGEFSASCVVTVGEGEWDTYEGGTVVIAGSDYQQNSTAPKSNTQKILTAIQKDYATANGFIFGGDYSQTINKNHDTTKGINELKRVVEGIYGTGLNEVFVQGNHDAAVSDLTATGAHDTDDYGVFSINEDDFSSSHSGSSVASTTMLTALESYLNEKVNGGYSKPVFVATHLPLHATSRGDNTSATKIFNLLNAAGASGLNIIFLFGHNHSQGFDAYLGNGSIYLKKGDSITVAGGSTSTLNFTYMNYGYVGYIGTNHGSADQTLTMTAFEIYEDEVIIKRYDANGQHVLKAAGNTTDSGYTADTKVYGQAVLSLSTGESTISEISADSGDDNSGSGGTTGGSGNVYTLDTDGVDAGEEYLIVSTGSDGNGSALTNNNGVTAGTDVTISGGKIELTVAGAEWTFSGTEGATATNGIEGYYLYPSTSGKDGEYLIRNEACEELVITGGTNGGYVIARDRGSIGTYYVTYDSSWDVSGSTSDTVYLFKRTGTGTGGGTTGGGSTVTPEGGDWVTVTEPNGGTVTYTYELATSITAGGSYVIVGNDHDVALTASMGGETVNVSGTKLTSNTALTEWTFSGTSSGTIMNGANYLRYSKSSGNFQVATTNSSNEFNYTYNTSESNFALQVNRDSGTDYYFYYNGSSWGRNADTQHVRLYKPAGTTPGDDATPGLYAKITGELEYNIERGLIAEEVLPLVRAEIKGYEYSGTSTPGDDVTGTEITEKLEFVMDSNYNGAKAGEYSVAIKYKGVTLGTAKVIVPAVAIRDYNCQTSGSVKVDATGKTRTGANITVNLEDGTSYTVPVTLDMLSGNFTTETAGTYTGLTVTYNGVVVCENFTLTVREPSSYPEYPDEGAVKVNKTGTGIQFQSTGVAQVEISASGIPMNQGVDVLLVLDTSSSMSMKGSLTDGRTRIDVLKECVNALIANLQAERDDGSVPDVQMAVVHFNGYTGNKSTNYIGSTARNTSTLGGTLTDDGHGGAWVDVQNMGSNWASVIPDNCSGTNYDHGLLQAYDLLSARKGVESSRKQFVLFMSDGAPFQYNGVNSNSVSSDWENWILGSYTQTQVENLSHVKNPEFYYGNNGGNGQKHRVAEAIKGTGSFDIVTYSNTSSSGTTKLETVPGLGITMYSVGLALEATNMPTDVAGQEAILKTIASSEDVFYSVTSAAGLQEAFDDFAGEVLMAATNARFVDQMGAAYKLQMGQILDLNKKPIDVENKIEILSYDIWTRSEYLAGECTLDQIGDRKGTSKPLETITFNADGTAVYSDKDSVGPDGQTIAAGSNILIDGIIYAQNFWYNTTSTGVAINGVDIPTGVESNDLTTGTSNVLPAETFYWKVGTIKTTELAMRYYVYLEGSMEGTRAAGSYPTNEYAILYYNNYLNQPLGQPCHKDTVSPIMAWDSANVSYAFYLVDENGNIIVNQTTGETGSFANKIAVTSPVVYEEVLLNNTDTVESIEVASTGVLPDGYELYDNASVYTIRINSDATGSWNIAKGTEKATTYVTHFDLNNPTAYSSEMSKSADADFTHTIVWFAVVWKVQALPDSVVIDYGLPVDISVLTNDMFGENGKLAGVGACTDALKLDGHDPALDSSFGKEYKAADSADDLLAYGDTEINAAAGKVRYTPKTTEMNGYDKFAYAVYYSGNENTGYYYDTVTVIPATTIYYEDSFVNLTGYKRDNADAPYAENANAWTPVGEYQDKTQSEDRPGKYSLSQIDANNVYGYDPAYNSMSTYSMGSAMMAHVDSNSYATATFSFYGTGFDVISLTSNMTGTLAVQVYQGDTLVRNTLVDTYYGMEEDGTISPNTPNALYQVPVIRIFGLDYGNYDVKITATYNSMLDHTGGEPGYDLYLDAIRIYDPAGVDDEDSQIEQTIQDAYIADGEAWPEYYELRDMIIEAKTFNSLGANDQTAGIVFIDSNNQNSDVADYKNYGPNNELYLASGQAVAFRMALGSNDSKPGYVPVVRIGLKTVGGETAVAEMWNVIGNSATHYNAISDELKTATDMYYDITVLNNNTVVIKNSGKTGSILSITNVKLTYKPTTLAASDNGEGDEDNGENQQPRMGFYVSKPAVNAALMSLAPVQEEIPEESVPETTVPETTVPEDTKPTEPVKPDNGELKEAVDAAKKLKAKDYTYASFKKLEFAIKAAEKVLKDKNATQTRIDQALENLNAALENLEAKPDNSELKAAVNAAKKLKAKDYTRASFKAVETARKAAEKVLKNKYATQAQIDEALENLNEAVDALETAAPKGKPGKKR